MPVCVSCGTENADDARYCVECGVAIGRATTPDIHPDEVVEDDVGTGGSSATERSQEPPPPDEEAPGGPV